MKANPRTLLLLALLALFPQGLTSEIYTTSAAEIAGSLGISLDEASAIKVLNMIGQLIALPLAAWLVYRIGNRRLFRLGAVTGLGSAIVSSLWMSMMPQLIAWFCHGVAASFLLVFAHHMVLKQLDYREIALVEGGMLLSVVLIPLGLYPYLLAHLAENNLWHWGFAIQVSAYLGMLYWAFQGTWPWTEQRQTIPFNWLQAVLFSGFVCGLTYLLLRGEHHNWFRNPDIVRITLITIALGVGAVICMAKGWGRGSYLFTDVLASRHSKAGMVDAAVAGFSILGTTTLTASYVTQVMHYSHLHLGRLELIGFAGMLMGLVIALLMTSKPGRDPEKVIPVGVAMIVLSAVLLTGSNAYSGIGDLWLPLLLKGVAVGILNVTLTIHILRSFPRRHLAEGIAWFYLFRNLGSLLAIGLFSRLTTFEASRIQTVLAENFDSTNEVFIHYQGIFEQLLQQSVLAPSAERAALLLSGQLQTQVMSVAGVNNYQWLILSMAALVPIMGIVMGWAKRGAH